MLPDEKLRQPPSCDEPEPTFRVSDLPDSGASPDQAPPTDTEGTAPQTYSQNNSPDSFSSADLAAAPGSGDFRFSETLALPPVPGYEPVRLLGEGTYGKVWLYHDPNTRKRVAVKFFTCGTTQEWLLLQAEVKQLSLMDDDPGIVQIKDVEPSVNPPYYMMTYAERGSLAQRLQQGPLPVAEALEIFRQVARSLAYVHAKGVRHCDLKPGNILLDALGRPLVGDFGQAHLASELTPSLGTFFYMAPEQATLDASIPDTRWDVYGLGALFYAMVTGQPPHKDQEVREQLLTASLSERLRLYRETVSKAPRPAAHRRAPGMDRRLADIIDSCLEANPAKRLRDAGAVLAALERRQRHRRRQPLLVFGLVAPVLLLSLMTLGGAILGRAALSQAENALADQLQNNNLVMARLVANILDEKLRESTVLLERHAREDDLVQAVKKRLPRAELRSWLVRYAREDTEQHFFKWTLADRQGQIIADALEEPAYHNRSWAWRDWFSGGGHKYGQENTWFPPVEQTHISQPYVFSGKKDRGGQEQLYLSISVPLREADSRQVLGLLVGTFPFDDLDHWVQGIGLHASHGFIVVLNEHRYCLLHREEEQIRHKIRPRPQANPEPLDSPLYTELIDRHREGTSAEHRDPLTGKVYLAGYAPLRSFGWGVVVQHERQASLQPIDALRHWMRQWGLIIFGSMSLLTSGLWGLLIWRLRREERQSHG